MRKRHVERRATSDAISGRQGDDTINAHGGNDLAHGGGGPALLDMTQLTMTEDYTGTVTFTSEGAGFKNALVIYKVAEDGTIGEVEVVFANASAQGSDGTLFSGQSSVQVELNAAD
ncbi:hypothetical protein EEB11_14965 [Pseudotabrizicola sediminis]|uniref:Uncharacterized protein n=1 Tax=Pseudotabrizicola sediminis TaxID=2486418 RepID=A0ABY2KIS2_9RHOB|nr:hypothetical protein [Pseudotabrizicola sediminis]TGD42255.1 hypothetical protein EEB11_14965 [Pseudotabrizicola sediminis]